METQHGQRQPGIWLLRAVFVCSRQMWSAIGRSLTVATMVLLAAAWSPQAIADPIDKSDMNNDGAVNVFDLEIFANTFLEQDWMTVNWCSFYEATQESEKYFREITSDRSSSYEFLLDFIRYYFFCAYVDDVGDLSDLNQDGYVDMEDVTQFSMTYLEMYWENVDWCGFYQAVMDGEEFNGRRTGYYLEHFTQLLDYINNWFECSGEPPPPSALLLENQPVQPYRIVDDTAYSGYYFATDPRVGSVFYYDADMVPRKELKGLSKPLGLAVDSQGHILVGNDGRDNIEVYDPATGNVVAIFGSGQVRMPNSISIAPSGDIYVTDSRMNTIWVFDAAYNLINRIGKAGNGARELSFPVDMKLVGNELIVVDQANYRLQFFDLTGSWQRTISVSAAGCDWAGRNCKVPGFLFLQAIELDSNNRLHVLDKSHALIHLVDFITGTRLASYASYGSGPGQLKVPMDITITNANQALVTAGDNGRIEVFAIQ